MTTNTATTITNTITTNVTRDEFVNQITALLGEYCREWVVEHIQLLEMGVNTLGCLGFLHGKEGRVEDICSSRPLWLRRTFERWANKNEVGVFYSDANIDWGHGTISWPQNGKTRQMKLGKWLRKAGSSPDQIKEFETRPMESWQWKISADLWDVLTMSHDRPWTSCMRPEGMYEKGPMTDMRSGAAVLFWYRPGASKPCGREILRPVVKDNQPMIARGGRTYGSGGSLSNKQLSESLGVPVIKVDLMSEKVTGLIDEVYCDIGRNGCHQTKGKAAKAEERLLFAWREFLQKGASVYKTYEVTEEKRKVYSSQPSERPRRIAEAHASIVRNMLRFEVRYAWRKEPVAIWERPEGRRRQEIESRLEVLERRAATL